MKAQRAFGRKFTRAALCDNATEMALNQYNATDVFNVSFKKGIVNKNDSVYDINKDRFNITKVNPYPSKVLVKPIVNLLVDPYFEYNNITTSNDTVISSVEIRKWFIPLYYNYCSVAGCQNVTTCQLRNECPLDTTCQGESTLHGMLYKEMLNKINSPLWLK